MKSHVELKYITLVQIVGCCLVILGHSFPFVTAYPSAVKVCIHFLYTFHMPLFVWCSGFLLALTMQSDRMSTAKYARKRAVKLLVPYFVISLIGLIPKLLASSVLNDNLNMDAVSIIRAFLVPRECVWGHFWFLPMILLIGILGFMVEKFSKKTTVWIMVVLASFALSFYQNDVLQWFAINDVLQFFMFFAAGVLCCRFTNNINFCHWSYIGSALLLSLVLFFSITSNALLIHTRDTLIAALMIFVIVQLCKKFDNSINVNRNSLIAQTYQIFILSWPCQLVAGIVIERILILSWMAFIPIVFATGIVAPLILLKLTDWLELKTHTRYISFLLGR